MKNYPARFVAIAVVILMLLVGIGNVANVWAQDESDAIYVTSPAQGATVSGLITITGATSFPDFLKYEIMLRPDKGDMKWVATVYAPVIDGNLARFDTRTYLNGTYQMVIRQVHSDSNYTEWNGPTITIDNELGAPLPYPEIEPSYLYAPEKHALVRLKNCSGVDLEFDYTSPEGFRSADDLKLEAKGQNTTYCPFEDFVLIPGEYRGTATGSGEKGYTYSFRAEAGQIYEMSYNGEGAGRFQLVVNKVEGDKRADTDKATSAITTGAKPVSAAAPAVVKDPTAVANPSAPSVVNEPTVADSTELASAPAQNQSVLPVTGKGELPSFPFMLIGAALVLLVVGGGVLAVLWRRGFSS